MTGIPSNLKDDQNILIFIISGYFGHFLGLGGISVILLVSRVFWSFLRFRGYFQLFFRFRGGILVIFRFQGYFGHF